MCEGLLQPKPTIPLSYDIIECKRMKYPLLAIPAGQTWVPQWWYYHSTQFGLLRRQLNRKHFSLSVWEFSNVIFGCLCDFKKSQNQKIIHVAKYNLLFRQDQLQDWSTFPKVMSSWVIRNLQGCRLHNLHRQTTLLADSNCAEKVFPCVQSDILFHLVTAVLFLLPLSTFKSMVPSSLHSFFVGSSEAFAISPWSHFSSKTQ